jgi:beta-lactamase class C
LKTVHQMGIGAAAFLLLGGAAVVMRPQPASDPAEATANRAHLQLASLSTDARQNVDYARLDARLKRLVEEHAMVGLAVGVVENGRITFLGGYGDTVEGSGDPVNAQTVFRWASLSKGVAATMVAKLAAQGKIDLQAPVAEYAPSLKLPNGMERQATVGDLLSHRLGLYRNAYDNKLEEGQDSRALRSMLGSLNLICAPGTCWSYQNVAYDAASEMVEDVSHKRYQKELREQLFNPIGMSSASVTRDGLVNSPHWARPHDAARRPLEVSDDYYRVPAAGGVNSNIKDLSLWMIAQMGEMPDVLSPKVLDTIHAPLVKTPSEVRRMRKFSDRIRDPYYGYGWRSYDYAGHHIVGHHGGVSGYRSTIMFDPVKKSGIVALWNSNTSQPNGIEIEVMDMIYGLPFHDWLKLDSPSARPASEPDAEDSDTVAARMERKGGTVVRAAS